MKVMAGYDTRNKTDYRAKAAEEVMKVQHKAKILEEMLQNHKEGDKIGDGDVFEVNSLVVCLYAVLIHVTGAGVGIVKRPPQDPEDVRRRVRRR